MAGIIDEMRRVVTAVTGDDKQAGEVVHALIKNFGGERLYIPGNNHALRNTEIQSLRRAGSSVCQLSKRYRLTSATIYRIINNSE